MLKSSHVPRAPTRVDHPIHAGLPRAWLTPDIQPARIRCAGLLTVMVRALQWLAGRPADFPVPPDFPTADKVSVRGEIPLPAPVMRP